MKEATGEFSMTVITIIAIVVIAGLIAWLSPRIAGYIQGTWTDVTGAGSNTNAANCPAGQYWNGSACINTIR